MRRLAWEGMAESKHLETKFSGANEDREKFIFLDELNTTSRIGSNTRLMPMLRDGQQQ